MSARNASRAASPPLAARVRACTNFDLTGLRLVVLEVEATVQLVFLADGWDGGPLKALANQFASPRTAGELRAIAEHLDRIVWDNLEGAAA